MVYRTYTNIIYIIDSKTYVWYIYNLDYNLFIKSYDLYTYLKVHDLCSRICTLVHVNNKHVAVCLILKCSGMHTIGLILTINDFS